MTLAVLAGLSCLTLVGCGSTDERAGQPAPDRSERSNATDAPEPRPACDEARYADYESLIGVTDDQGHGPDIGSSEWQSSIERQLGLNRPEGWSTGGGQTWCDAIDQVLSGMHERGYGEIMIGEAVGDTPLTILPSALPSAGECDMAYLGEMEEILFMVVDDRVARVDVLQGDDRLPNGLGIGSTGDEILAAYGDRVTVEPHKYVADASYYSVKISDEIGIVFEVAGSKTLEYHVGRFPEVTWVEGCL